MADSDLQQQPDPAPAEQDGFSAAFKEATTPPADGDKPTAKEPAPDKAGSAEAAAKADAADSSEPAEKADPLANLSPEQLRQRLTESEAERERLRTLERRQRGTVGALTRKLNNLNSTPAPSPAPAPAKQEEKPSESSEGTGTVSDLDKRLQAVTDEYGDVVGPVVELLNEVRGEIDKIKNVATTRGEVDADAEELTEALGALEQVHPDYAEYNQTNAPFTAWLGAQSPKVIELANSYDPREVSLALTLFKTERSAALAKSDEAGDRKDASAADERRQRQIDGSRQVTARGVPAAAGVPNEFSSAWKARAAAKT